MNVDVALRHSTFYDFDRPVNLGPHIVRLHPAAHTSIPIRDYSQAVFPSDHLVHWQQDPFANQIARYVFPNPAQQLSVSVKLIATLKQKNPYDFLLDDSAKELPVGYDPELLPDLSPYLQLSESCHLLRDWLPPLRLDSGSTIQVVTDLAEKIANDIEYVHRLEAGVQPCDITLQKRSGSCRDTAWLLIQALRHAGIAARFTSGYLIDLDNDGRLLAHEVELHAWAEMYLSGAGWIGLDPTSGLLAGPGHLALACSPRPATAAPISGSTSEANVELRVESSLVRLS